jgi:hypothetical protein
MFLGVGLQKHPINGSKKFLFLSNKSTKSRVSQIHLFRDLFKLFSFALLDFIHKNYSLAMADPQDIDSLLETKDCRLIIKLLVASFVLAAIVLFLILFFGKRG